MKRIKYFLIFFVALIAFVFFLIYLQKRIKEENLSNFSLYQEAFARYISFEFSQFLRLRETGLTIISSLDSVKTKDIARLTKDLQDYLNYVREQHVKGIFLYDEKGLILYSNFKRTKVEDHSETDFFKECKRAERGKIFVIPLLNLDHKKLFPSIDLRPSDLLLITPVYSDSKGKEVFSGALSIILDLKSYIDNKLRTYGIREFSEILVLWKDGTILYSRFHPEMERRNIWEKDCLNCHSSMTPFFKAMKEPHGDFEFFFGRDRKIANFQTVETENISLKLIVYSPYKNITSLARKSLTGTLIFTLALISAFSFLFLMLMRANIQKIKADEKVKSLRTRLELEEKLRKTEEKFYTFGNITSDGIWLYKSKVPIPIELPVDEQIEMIFEHGYLEWCNDSMAKMYGLESKEQLIGAPLKDTLNPEDPRNVEFIRAFIESGYNLKNYESYEKDIHGKTHVFLNSLQGVTKDRHLIEAWGSQKDITELKEMEEEKKKLENQLFQVQKMEAVGRLTGGIAHDFNNILTAIIGNAELTLSGMAPTDPNYRRIKSILDSAKRASNLTKKLLTFSRKQLGEPVIANLNEVIKSMEDILRRTIGEDINFTISLEKNLKPVKIETTQMEQVILNLVVNAREAMPEGGNLTISTKNVFLSNKKCIFCSDPINGEYVELSVSDTGVGIPPEIRDKIFEPFYSTKKDGTGLGLSIVYGVVSEMKGHLNFESEPGKGTTFHVYLPVYKGEKKEEFKRLKIGVEEIKGGDETILIVEDEREILDMMKDFLTDLGYNVLSASNAEEAIEKIKGIPRIDLLVTDVILPGKKGPDFAKELRIIYPYIKVLFVSGYPKDRISTKAVWDGEINFLSKPFTPFDLAEKIRKILDKD